MTAATFVFYVLNTLVLTKRPPIFTKTHGFMLGMVGCLYLSSIFAVADKTVAYDQSLVFLKLFVFVFLMTNLLTTLTRFKLFLATIGAFCGLMSLRAIYMYMQYGVDRVDTVGGLQGGANELAAMLISVFPLFWYFAASRKFWEKIPARLGIFLLPTGVVTTGSRAGAIGIGVVLLGIFLNSQRKGVLAVTLVVCLAGVIAIIPASYKERVATISDYESDASAMNRIILWQGGLDMWADYPLTGVGPENFVLLSHEYTGLMTKNLGGFVAHSTYVSLLAEAGAQALLLFCLLAGWSLYTLRRVRKRYAGSRWDELESLARIAAGIEIGIWSLLTIGIFGTFEYSDFLYWFFGAASCVAVLEKALRKKYVESEIVTSA
jgi:O-antigen ligase